MAATTPDTTAERRLAALINRLENEAQRVERNADQRGRAAKAADAKRQDPACLPEHHAALAILGARRRAEAGVYEEVSVHLRLLLAQARGLLR